MRNIIYPDEYLELIAAASKRGLTKKAAKELGIGGQMHHIIPKCVAPELIKEKSNIVFLTYEEHYNAHKLLALANPDDAIAFAWSAMQTKKETGEFFTAEDYAKAMKLSINLRIGKHRPDEEKKKISESLKGRPAHNKGIPHSEDHKRKIREAHKGKTFGFLKQPIKIYTEEYPYIIFESYHDAELRSKELGWTGIYNGQFPKYFKGKGKSLGKDSNGNKLHWKKVET